VPETDGAWLIIDVAVSKRLLLEHGSVGLGCAISKLALPMLVILAIRRSCASSSRYESLCGLVQAT
jgi:hypothetical protein